MDKKKIEIDQRATDAFVDLGYNPIPEGLKALYVDFKRRKDIINAGPLTSEGFAYLSLVWDKSQIQEPGRPKV